MLRFFEFFRVNSYQRYLMRETAASTLLVLTAFLALFSFFDLIGELRNVGQGDYEFHEVLLVVALRLPGMIYELIPIAVLIGTLYALSTLARHSEITVLRASGLATRDLLFTLFRMAAGFAVLTFLVGEVLAPFTERLGREIQTRELSRVVGQQGFDSGVWLKDGRTFINIKEVTPDAVLHGVRIYSFSPESELESVTEAELARNEKEGVWQLAQVSRTVLAGERASVERMAGIEWQSSVTPGLLSVLMVAPERMSFYSLWNYTRHLTENHQKTDRYLIALWKKLIYPLAALVMVALALPFGYSHNRVGGVSLKIFSGVMLGILFYALNGLFSNLGVINAWHPFASASLPSAIFLLAAMVMLWWVERR